MRVKSISNNVLRALAFCLCMSLSLCRLQAQATPTQEQQLLLDLLNGERTKAGLKKLMWDEHLAQSAGAHVDKMAEHGQLSHQFPEEPELSQRIAATGLRYSAAAENVAYAPTIERAHDGLMHSPPHRANILNPDYNAVGFGIVVHEGEYYIAQNFAYVLHTYTDTEFRDTVTAAFNKFRQTHGLPQLDMQPDSTVQAAACSDNNDPNVILEVIPKAMALELFTSSTPDKLPDHMRTTALDNRLKHMSVGACFKPGSEHGYGSFKVVAVFFAN